MNPNLNIESHSFEDKIDELIGRPYDALNFHCWSLVEELVPCAPKLDVIGGNATGDYRNVIKQFQEEQDKYDGQFLHITDDPQAYDIVLAGNTKHISHAGVYFESEGVAFIIHNDKNGVHVEPLYYFKKNYSTIRLFRCKN